MQTQPGRNDLLTRGSFGGTAFVQDLFFFSTSQEGLPTLCQNDDVKRSVNKNRV
jgi:hypothetical protein